MNHIENIDHIIARSTGWIVPSKKMPSYQTYRLHWKKLFMKLYAQFDITVPKGIDKEYLKTSLIVDGYSAFFRTIGKDYVQTCRVHDINEYNKPKYCNVVNRFFDLQDMEIGNHCELIHGLPYGLTVADFINYIACKMTLLDTGIDMSIINSRLQYAVGVRDTASEQTVLSLAEKAIKGEPLVCVDSHICENKTDHAEGWQVFERKNMPYILTNQLDDFATLESMFDEWIGIQTTPEKRERVQSAEVEAYNDGNDWLKQLFLATTKECFEKVKEHYNVTFEIKWKGDESNVIREPENDNPRNTGNG